MVKFLALLVLLAVAFKADSRELAGVKLDEVVTLSIGGTQLKLKGSAVRMRAQHAIYVGGLYVDDNQLDVSSSDALFDGEGAKRFVINCRTKHISAEKMVEAIEQGVAINHSQQDMQLLKPELEKFKRIWRIGIKEGDEVWFDYVPNRGTIISINGEQQAEIAGEQFYAALLKIWLGDHPVNSRMKQALLGLVE